MHHLPFDLQLYLFTFLDAPYPLVRACPRDFQKAWFLYSRRHLRIDACAFPIEAKEFDRVFNAMNPASLSSRAREVSFHDRVNQRLDLFSFERMTSLTVGTHFDSSLVFPPRLEKFKSGFFYNFPLPFSLPQSLHVLELGVGFNHPLDLRGTCVKELTLGSRFHNTLRLSETLTHLTCRGGIENVNQWTAIETSNLLELDLRDIHPQLEFDLPPSIECFIWRGRRTWIRLNSSLRHLVWKSPHPPLGEELPSTLVDLVIGDSVAEEFPPLPVSLQVLSLGALFHQPLTQLPPRLQQLEIHNQLYAHPPPLPSTLMRLLWRPIRTPVYFPETLETVYWLSTSRIPRRATHLPRLKYCRLYWNYGHTVQFPKSVKVQYNCSKFTPRPNGEDIEYAYQW